jgi:hypothetical protein
MKKFSIKINYNTGDSFNSETDVEGVIEISWENEEVAKRNLKRIEEHYTYYLDIHNHSRLDSSKKRLKELTEAAKTKDWYSHPYPNIIILLEEDSGKMTSVISFWTGYFESLNDAEIVENLDDSDRKVTFRGKRY